MVLTLCKFCGGMLQNGSVKHQKLTWAKLFSVDFHSPDFGIATDTSIIFIQYGNKAVTKIWTSKIWKFLVVVYSSKFGEF